MAAPLVSIVLPTYNGSRYLSESIESCLAQTYGNWELIVVDDCSTDATPGIVDQYVEMDPRIRSIRHETNRKLPAALNTGFAAAQGVYYTWTSDDNRYKPTALAEMVDFLEQAPEVDVTYAQMDIEYSDGSVRVRDAGPPEDLVLRDCVGACFLYRRRVQDALGGYREELFCAEDYDFWLRAWAQFELRPIHRNLYFYRLHEDSLTMQRRGQVRAAAEKALADVIDELDWLEPEQQLLGYLRLVRLADGRGDIRSSVARIRRALALARRYRRAGRMKAYQAICGASRELLRRGSTRQARMLALGAVTLRPLGRAGYRLLAETLPGGERLLQVVSRMRHPKGTAEVGA